MDKSDINEREKRATQARFYYALKVRDTRRGGRFSRKAPQKLYSTHSVSLASVGVKFFASLSPKGEAEFFCKSHNREIKFDPPKAMASVGVKFFASLSFKKATEGLKLKV
ncbi:MAG: hypothetical protein ACI4QR_06775 [Eubacteriales bacterium]